MSSPSAKSQQERPLYEADLHSWAAQQAALLRKGRLSELDLVHIAEELDDVGSEIYQRLESALTVLLMHMLKWDYQPDHRSRSWEATIREQRRRIGKLIKDNPSLKAKLPEALSEGYQNGRDRASGETDLRVETFPEECPYPWEAVLKREFSVDAPAVKSGDRTPDAAKHARKSALAKQIVAAARTRKLPIPDNVEEKLVIYAEEDDLRAMVKEVETAASFRDMLDVHSIVLPEYGDD